MKLLSLYIINTVYEIDNMTITELKNLLNLINSTNKKYFEEETKIIKERIKKIGSENNG